MLTGVREVGVALLLVALGAFGCLVVIWPRVAWLQWGRGPLGQRSPMTKAKVDAVPDGAVIVMRIVGAGVIVFCACALWALVTG